MRKRLFERPGERVEARHWMQAAKIGASMLGSAAAGAAQGGSGKKGGGGGGHGLSFLKRQIEAQTKLQQDQFQREQPFYDVGAQRAQFGAGFLPDIATALRNPTANPYYDLASREGLNQIRNAYSVTGSPSSGPGQLAGGRFVAGLQADQVNQMLNRLFGVGMANVPEPGSQAAGYSGTIGNLSNAYTGLRFEGQPTSQGANAGYGALGGLFNSLPGLSSLGSSAGTTPATGTGIFGVPGQATPFDLNSAGTTFSMFGY